MTETVLSYIDGEIEGVVIRPLRFFHDSRGWLVELFRQDDVTKESWPVMTYVSQTLPGVARGPHEHVDQADYFCFSGPSTFRVYLWDTRKSSPTCDAKEIREVGEKLPYALIVPAGVVHAYKNVGGEPGLVFNCPNRLYRGPGKKEPVDEIRHEEEKGSPYRLE